MKENKQGIIRICLIFENILTCYFHFLFLKIGLHIQIFKILKGVYYLKLKFFQITKMSQLVL